jgi:3-dehydroquinate synthase
MSIRTIHSRQRDYDVIIETGLLARLKPFCQPNTVYVIITDSGVPSVYVEQVKQAFGEPLVLRFEQGEESKSLSTYEHIIERLVRANVKKDAVLIALGGGVVGDLCGFVASTYLRGVDYIQIPTTLLSQIDSSVGGKVAVNTRLAKNIIGHVYPPKLVLIDPATLATLSPRQFSNGMAEMIKIAATADAELFERIKSKAVLNDLEAAIARSVELKKQYVEADEFDQSVRQYLNFGHTFGHAIETYYRYEKYLHGEAVAIGMVRIASRKHIKEQLIECLRAYDLPIEDPVVEADLLETILRDKKARNNSFKIIDVPVIGSAEFRVYAFEPKGEHS